MADEAVVHIGENSPEQVAYKLMIDLRSIENRYPEHQQADRKWLLDTYAECLEAVKGHRSF